MKLFVLIFFLVITAPLFAADNELSAEEKAAGWKLLFDGKTTAGWRGIGKQEFPAKGWEVTDGALRHLPKAGGGDLVTVEDFENFELVWDWKITEAGNSGIKYNLANKDKALGFEYQLLDDKKHPDGVKHGSVRHTAALYDLIEPAADKKMNPVGEWNTSRLVVNGSKVEHWLNGAKALEFEMSSPEMKERIAKSKYKNAAGFGEKKASPILLQDHVDEVWLKNIKLRVTR